jgi:hypothetical protein
MYLLTMSTYSFEKYLFSSIAHLWVRLTALWDLKFF